MTARRAAPPSLDVFLQPAVVGGGLGDIEEVLAVGRRLERHGWSLSLYRRKGRALPPSVAGPWHWPRVQRVRQLRARARHALTVTPWWGVSAVPDAERSGPPGPWSAETADIEAAYGPASVVHLSLEEFARTLTSRQQTRERWREGGVAVREIARRGHAPATRSEVRTFHDAYRKWRAFDRENVLHLFSGFRPSRAFGREFPEAVQVGPLWPERPPQRRRRAPGPHWIWYASPSTSDRLARKLADALPTPPPGGVPVQIEVRGPRRFDLPPSAGVRWRWLPPSAPTDWGPRFRSADLRLITGSRTLLEALAVGGPFLYFNGVLNQGARTRRHRPEKIDSLLESWRRGGVSPRLCNDLSDFSRLRRVGPIVQRAIRDPRWSSRFPPRSSSTTYPSGRADAGAFLDAWVREWAGSPDASSEFVGRWRGTVPVPRSRL